ncbi:MAG: carboxypeptidase-like regulatory domain-containing protein [Planctomycetes bacterium]|nr:carboxypeptidase-like regulatory domain-containing protein [Planctomycetota bacterium]
MAPSGIESAFELVQTSMDLGIPDLPGVPLVGTLVGEGRVAILTPVILLNGMTYRVELADGAKLLDRTGQALDLGFTGAVGTFTVAETPSTTPELLTMWPQDGSTDQSTMPEVLAIFDREMDVGSVLNPGAFSVTVNGSPPTNNPSVTVLTVAQIFGTVLTLPQVFTWRSFEPDGEPALLGENSIVALDLAGSIESEQGESYPGSSTSFGTASVNPPAAVAITSTPTDAFGVSHMNGTIPIEVTVTLEDAASSGDFLTLYIYGNSEDAGSLSLLSREVAVAGGAAEVVLGEPLLDIVDDSAIARFADGSLYIAASLRRGDVRSPVRLLDTDTTEAGDQPAVLDTVAPTLVGLGADGSQTTEYVSTTAGVRVIGLADEELAAVEVSLILDGALSTNGELAPVAGANAQGGFVAAPLDLGIVDPLTLPGALTVTIYDRAMNPAVPLDLSWRQVGASGPGAALPGGGDISVRVFDAGTDQPVEGAIVFSHAASALDAFLSGGVTDAAGATLVPSAAADDTVVTVDAAGYDLFTFHGVPTTRLDIPLQPSTPRPGRIFYTAISDVSALADPTVAVRVADDRLIAGPTHDPLSCADSPFGVLCGFPSADITAGRFGTPTLLATVDQDPLDFTPESFLKVAQLDFLTDAAQPDGKVSLNYDITGFLSDVGVDPEERPLWAPGAILDTSLLVALDTSNLVNGEPSVLIEGAVSSLGTTATVGAGIADDPFGTSIWALQGAFAGAADGVSDDPEDQLGRWVSEGLIEEDLFMRVDLEDNLGNATGRRVRFSALSGAPLFTAPDVPILLSPAFATGGSAFQVEFADTLDDTQDGLFRVRLTDITGRSWEVWHLNEPGSGASITANLPAIALPGGQPLADGPLEVVVSLQGTAAADFDPTAFLWAELSASADARARTAIAGLQQP